MGIHFQPTQYGFEYGSASITRIHSNAEKGWVILGIDTPQKKLQAYISKTGRIRILEQNGSEWKQPEAQPQSVPEAAPAPAAKHTAKATRHTMTPKDMLFELFWKAYPTGCRGKSGKGSALKAWTKIRPSDAMAAQIIDAVHKWSTCDQWRKSNGQFIPNPTTWLHQRRWEDELPSKITPPGSDIAGEGDMTW